MEKEKERKKKKQTNNGERKQEMCLSCLSYSSAGKLAFKSNIKSYSGRLKAVSQQK